MYPTAFIHKAKLYLDYNFLQELISLNASTLHTLADK